MRFGFVNLDKKISFEEIASEWYPKITYFVRKRNPKYCNNEELIQELMLHLLEKSDRYRNPQSEFTTFAWTCIRNKISDLTKAARIRGVIQPKQKMYKFSWSEVEFDLLCQNTIKHLTPKQAAVFSLLKDGFKKSEVAKKLGVVQSRISGIIKELQNNFYIREMINV